MTNGENIVDSAVNRLAEFQNEQSLVTKANSTPLPGPLCDVFAPVQAITVGPYTVRPMLDRDLEFLQFLDNPLYGHFYDKKADMLQFIQGQTAYELCYLFTHPFKDIKALFKSKEPKDIKQMAEDEFEEMGLTGHLEIIKAIMQQVEIYWSPVIGHSSADDVDGSKKNTLADGTDKPVMDSDSSSKSVAS